MGQDTERQSLTGGDASLLAVIRELQMSLYVIARKAELADYKDKSIRSMADQALLLTDSYLLSAQTERGQTTLDLVPIAIGSILHGTQQALIEQSVVASKEIRVEARAHVPVMTNASALHSALLASALVVAEARKEPADPLVLRSYVEQGGRVGVGVFARNITLRSADLERVLQSDDLGRMGLPKHSTKTGVSLKIADSLCRALGGMLEVKRMGSYYGLSTVLPKSEQLSLIGTA